MAGPCNIAAVSRRRRSGRRALPPPRPPWPRREWAREMSAPSARASRAFPTPSGGSSSTPVCRPAFPGASVRVEPDYAVALTGATDGEPGIVVIAGTGSVAYGENGAGRRTGRAPTAT